MKALYFEIVHKITEQINDNILKEGEKIPSERDLAQTFDVSRNVVREALSVLRAKGLIKVQPGKGAYVAKPDPTIITETMERIMKNYNTSIEDVLEVREDLEKTIINKAVNAATEDDISELYGHYKKMELNIGNIPKYVELDVEFHMLLAKCTKNPLYLILNNSFIEMTQNILFSFTSLIPEGVIQAQEHHLALIMAIENKDKKKAFSVIKSHMQILRDEIDILKAKNLL